MSDRRVSILVLLLFVLSACGEAEVLTASRHPILGGAPTSEHPAVWALTQRHAGVYCTGTLVDPLHVLTAAHCVTDDYGRVFAPSAFFICPDRQTQGQDSACYVSPQAVDGEPVVQAHPGFGASGPGGLAHDLAVIGVRPTGITPKPLPTGALPLESIGTDARATGYGIIEDGEMPEARYTVRTRITHLGPMFSRDTGANPFGLVSGTFQSGPDTCNGDSGGPIFWPADDPAETLVGTVSWGDGDCALYSVNVDVGADLCWLESVGVTTAVCPFPREPELCGGGVDEDLDALTDCDDPDCSGDRFCTQGPGCQEAQDLRCESTLTASTRSGLRRTSEYACSEDGAWTGLERAFRVTAPAGTRVVATLRPELENLDLFALGRVDQGCHPALCEAASIGLGDTVERVDFVVPESGAFLVVETVAEPTRFTIDLHCVVGEEVCDNAADDDDDGLADCEDPECAPAPGCAVEMCSNEVDDDGDGLADCLDPDCEGNWACPPELCEGGLDEDRDGAIDCEDPDCAIDCPEEGGGGAGTPSCGCAGPGSGAEGLLPLALLILFWRKRIGQMV